MLDEELNRPSQRPYAQAWDAGRSCMLGLPGCNRICHTSSTGSALSRLVLHLSWLLTPWTRRVDSASEASYSEGLANREPSGDDASSTDLLAQFPQLPNPEPLADPESENQGQQNVEASQALQIVRNFAVVRCPYALLQRAWPPDVVRPHAAGP